MVSAFYFLGSKQKFGRGVGLPGAPRPTTSSGTRTTPSRTAACPAASGRPQVDHTFSPNFFMSAKAAYYDTGFGLVPRGGDRPDLHARLRDGRGDRLLPGLPGHPSAEDRQPGRQLLLRGHGRQQRAEVRLRLPRPTTTSSISTTAATRLAGIINAPDDKIAYVWRDGLHRTTAASTSAPTSATSSPRTASPSTSACASTGQTAKNLASEVPANASFPNVAARP